MELKSLGMESRRFNLRQLLCNALMLCWKYKAMALPVLVQDPETLLLMVCAEKKLGERQGRMLLIWFRKGVNPTILPFLFYRLATQSQRPLLLLLCQGVILIKWDPFDPKTLKKTWKMLFCNPSFPEHQLWDEEKCPLEGSISLTMLHLGLFCLEEGAWSEIPYV